MCCLWPRSVKLIGFQVSKSGAKGKPLNSGCTDDFRPGISRNATALTLCTSGTEKLIYSIV
jgi:hypothetical protein